MADDLQERLRSALAAERDAEANVTKIRDHIAAALDAAERARGERRNAAERVAAGEDVNISRIVQRVAQAEAEAELLNESLSLSEQRLAQSRGAVEAVLSSFAHKRALAAQEAHKRASEAFKAAAKAQESTWHALNSANRLPSADGSVLRSVFAAELAAAAAA